jgi:hypothetical protein
MPRPRFKLERSGETHLLKCIGDGISTETRELADDDWDRFDAWIRAYKRELRRPDPAGEMLALGRAVYDWLNSEGEGRHWMTRLMASGPSHPFLIEFQVPPNPNERYRRFLEVPWELLADR